MVKINTSFKKNDCNNLHSAHNKLTNNLFNEMYMISWTCVVLLNRNQDQMLPSGDFPSRHSLGPSKLWMTMRLNKLCSVIHVNL